MVDGETLAQRFLREIDARIPAEIGGYSVSTDRVLTPTHRDSVVLQFYLVDDPEQRTSFVTASGKEIRMCEGDLGGLAERRWLACRRQFETQFRVPAET